jgi:hypothetical protein
MQFATGNLAIAVLSILAAGYVAHWFPRGALDGIGRGWVWLPAPLQAAIVVLVALGLYYISGTEAQFIYGNF